MSQTQTQRYAIPPFIADWELVTSYAEAEEVIKSPDFQAGRLETESLPFRGTVLIELDGEAHRARRQLEGPLFSRAAIRFYELNVLDEMIRRNLADAARHRDADGVVRANLVDLSTSMFLQVAAQIIGLDGVDTEARTARLNRYFTALDNAIVVKWSTRDHQEVIREGLEAKTGFIRDFVAPALERRRALIADFQAGRVQREALPLDLFTLMLLHPSPEWDADQITREAIGYLAATIGSSTAATVFAVDELDQWLRAHPEDRARLDDTAFLRRMVNESLRLRATFPAMIRWAVRDTTLKSGRRIAAGSKVAIINQAINTDPAVFGPDADQFNPYRALPPGVHAYGLAFGTGAKSCIGKGLITTAQESADGELDRALVKILKAFYRAGLVVERERGVERAPTAEVRFTVFPVRFDHL
jgi:cytochrome P450